jgi:glucokinase
MNLINEGDQDTFLALDIGGTNVTSGLVARSGKILGTTVFSTSKGQNPGHLIDLIALELKGLWAKAPPDRRPKALAIGAPGWLKPREGILVVAPNIPGWRDVPITRLMSQALDIPAFLENDANLYALGEWLAGAGQGSRNQITLTLGTGVGGGLILNDRLWSGSFASAAEVGHIPLGGGYEALCGCGRVGCLETMASARGMTRQAQEWLDSGRKSLYDPSLGPLNPEVMRLLAGEGDPMSLSVFREAGLALGLVLSGVFNLLSLETAVIGGGASGAFEFLEPYILEVLSARLVTASAEEIRVVKGQLGVYAPLVGAVALLSDSGH